MKGWGAHDIVVIIIEKYRKIIKCWRSIINRNTLINLLYINA